MLEILGEVRRKIGNWVIVEKPVGESLVSSFYPPKGVDHSEGVPLADVLTAKLARMRQEETRHEVDISQKR